MGRDDARPQDASGRGWLITFEGGEGAGKSTLVAAVRETLQARGVDVETSREPGGTPAGERIRRLLLDDAPEPFLPIAEALLHTAARAEHVERWIRPRLEAGTTLLIDRFSDSTRVYQGVARGLGRAAVDRLQELAFGSLEADLTILLDLPVEVGLERAAAAGDVNRYERLGVDFHRRVRAGFLGLAEAEPHRIKVLDAARPAEAVRREAVAIVQRMLAKRAPGAR